MKIITINNKQYNFPESWDELTGKQLLRVMAALYLKNYRAEHMLLQLVKVLAGMTQYQFLRANVEELQEFFYLTAFVLQPDLVFTKNHLQYYKQEEELFYGPADGLDNLIMKEFTFTEDYFIRWMDSEKQDEEALHQLIAILYRPGKKDYDFEKNPEDDCREAFNQNISIWNAHNIISKWPPSVKLAIATWYNGCRRALVERNPEIFGGTGGDPALYGLVSVMLDLAETNVFGEFAKVEVQNVNLVLMQLNQQVVKARKIKEETRQ